MYLNVDLRSTRQYFTYTTAPRIVDVKKPSRNPTRAPLVGLNSRVF